VNDVNVWTIGGVTVTRIVEREMTADWAHLLADTSADKISQHLPWMYPMFVDDDGNPLMSISALGIETPDYKMIVDTCIGNDRSLPGHGIDQFLVNTPFLKKLEAAGFGRYEVDIVICTHLHIDHVGWNTMLVDGEWVPTFPNARYLFCVEEWNHWTETEEKGLALTLDDAVQPVIDAGLHEFVPNDHRITGEIRLEPSPGHTPGHVCVHIESAGHRALITGDAAHHPVQLVEPSWSANSDSDPTQAAVTRRRLVGELADSNALVIGTHFRTPAAGRIIKLPDGYRYEPSTG
jgi:glyoxylase-like metal-dependent hydrolase (beta-lactamase superfamily II)